MHLHIQILWNIFKATDLPTPPTPQQIATFRARFASADAWDEFKSTITYNSTEATAKIAALRTSAARFHSPIARNIVAIDDKFLQTIFSSVISSGFREWRPDVIGSTRDGLYNLAHEDIAIDTFKRVAQRHAYVRLSPDLMHLDDSDLLQRLYRNYVWSNMRKKLLSEAATPGAVVARMEITGKYKRRRTVCLYYCCYYSRILTLQPACKRTVQLH